VLPRAKGSSWRRMADMLGNPHAQGSGRRTDPW